MRKLQLIFFTLCGLCSFLSPVYAADLVVEPTICIKTQSSPTCDLHSQVNFSQKHPNRVCINAEHVNYQRCFASQTDINYQLYIQPRESFSLQVTDMVQRSTVAEVWVRVLNYDPEKTRVKRRFGWGF